MRKGPKGIWMVRSCCADNGDGEEGCSRVGFDGKDTGNVEMWWVGCEHIKVLLTNFLKILGFGAQEGDASTWSTYSTMYMASMDNKTAFHVARRKVFRCTSDSIPVMLADMHCCGSCRAEIWFFGFFRQGCVEALSHDGSNW